MKEGLPRPNNRSGYVRFRYSRTKILQCINTDLITIILTECFWVNLGIYVPINISVTLPFHIDLKTAFVFSLFSFHFHTWLWWKLKISSQVNPTVSLNNHSLDKTVSQHFVGMHWLKCLFTTFFYKMLCSWPLPFFWCWQITMGLFDRLCVKQFQRLK